MEVMDVEAADVILNGTEGIMVVGIQKGKNPIPEAKAWVLPLKDGMEVEPNIAVLGVMKGMEIVPPPCMDTIVCILVALMVDSMLPEVVIKGKD